VTAPTIVGSVAASRAGSGTSLDIAMPAGIQEGETLIVVWAHQTTSGSINVPSGWTQRGRTEIDGGTRIIAVFTREATDSEPASYNWSHTGTSGRQVAVAFRVEGIDNTDPVNAFSSVIWTSGSPTLTAPTCTVTEDDCLLLSVFHANIS
jgi:hypothetical protein